MKLFKWIAFWSLPLLILACGGADSSNTSANSQTFGDLGPKPNSVGIQSETGDELIQFDFNGGETIIKYERLKNALNGRKDKPDKSKYYNQKGDLVAEVKFKDDGFKLRDSNAKLYWKVKIKDGKIKISDNEEGENPFELQENENGKFKIKLSEEQLVEGKWKDGKITVRGKGGVFVVPAGRNHPAYTVLALPKLSEEHRLIVVAELLRQL
ncbi:MAG: hypothetical protein HC913_21445 [Microscillaceae bacterium]|nr:hypothetical protein [Microscillaceae bacterium]